MTSKLLIAVSKIGTVSVSTVAKIKADKNYMFKFRAKENESNLN
jgi:hypothetical protein